MSADKPDRVEHREQPPVVAQGGARTFKAKVEVLFRRLDQEGVLLNLETGAYFGLNRSGAVVWEALQQDGDFERAVAALTEQFGIDPELARRDAEALVGDLRDAGLLTPL